MRKQSKISEVLSLGEIVKTSRFKNVYKAKSKYNLKRPWRASPKLFGKLKYIGSFASEFEASMALYQFEKNNNLPLSNNLEELSIIN